jgi:hypothetical protein
MRFMMIIKSDAATEAGVLPAPEEFEAMGRYNEELIDAGVLLDANGLRPSAKGWRIRYADGRRQVVDGPFAETKELIAGYTLIQVRSRDEAMEWTRRFPAPFEGIPCEIEVRPLFELDDFAPGDSVERFRELEAARG